MLEQEIDDVKESKEAVKNDNQKLNDKIVKLEQQVYESKTIGLELIE